METTNDRAPSLFLGIAVSYSELFVCSFPILIALQNIHILHFSGGSLIYPKSLLYFEFRITMKSILALLSLIVPLTVGQTVVNTINNLQASEPTILDQAALSDSGSYQFQARQSAALYLSSPTTVEIRNYYALACIYYATNGVGNVRTDEIIPGAVIPTWLKDNEWIVNPDYCQWLGITCNAARNVVAIDLHENQLYGEWPNEVVLLKNNLQLIELFNNFFLHSVEPVWLTKMGELQFLFIGTTSFDYNGIPTYLNGCKKLRKLNIFC
jgi:hypothetical protein